MRVRSPRVREPRRAVVYGQCKLPDFFSDFYLFNFSQMQEITGGFDYRAGRKIIIY